MIESIGNGNPKKIIPYNTDITAVNQQEETVSMVNFRSAKPHQILLLALLPASLAFSPVAPIHSFVSAQPTTSTSTSLCSASNTAPAIPMWAQHEISITAPSRGCHLITDEGVNCYNAEIDSTTFIGKCKGKVRSKYPLPLWADSNPSDSFVSMLRRCVMFVVVSILLFVVFNVHVPSFERNDINPFKTDHSVFVDIQTISDNLDDSTPPPDDDKKSLRTTPNAPGYLMYPDLIDGHNPQSIALFDQYIKTHSSGTFSLTPKLESVEDSIGNLNTNIIVSNVVLSDVSNVADYRDAKRQKIASPTESPTSVCNTDDYQRRRDSNAIDIGTSATRAYSGNVRYTALIRDAADDMMRIVTDFEPSFVYNPESPDVPINVMEMVCNNLSQCTHQHMWSNSNTTNQTVIYAHVNDASNRVEYVGYTSNYTQRLKYHQEEKGADYFNHRTSIRLVSYDNIPHLVDRLLSDRLIRFWNEVLQLNDLPPTLRHMYEKLTESWHRGGPKKQMSAQLIEIGAQRRYNMRSIMAEAFMYDEEKETTLRNYATQAGETLTVMINNVWGPDASINPDQPFGIQTWKTGAADDRLSSAIVATEYMLGNENWKDTFPYAIYPNAKTPEEIFTAPTSPEHLAFGLANFRKFLRPYAQNSMRHSFVLVDTQDYLFGTLVGPQMELCKLGFELVDTLLGGEIIVFRKDNALALLHGHPANACDSRGEISVVHRQRRAVAIDALRIARQRAVGDNSPRRFDAIRGSIYSEIHDRGWHGSRRFGAAICRDNMYDRDAIAAFGGGLTPADINHPTSDVARTLRNEPRDNLWNMQRFTDTISQLGVRDAVRSMHSYLVESDMSLNNQIRKWKDVIDRYQGHAELQQRVRDAARELPSGGDQASQRASMDVNDVIRSDIIECNREGKPLANFRFFIVKKDKTFDAAEFAGLKVYNIFTATNQERKPTEIFRNLARHSTVKELISGFKCVSRAEEKEYLARIGVNVEVPNIIGMYKLKLPTE